MNTRYLILFLTFVLAQCTHAVNRVPAPEDLYLEEGFAVISTSFNPAGQTTSILFGNTAARESANSGYAAHSAGEDYRLVTWNQHGNPLWFGGYINGSIKSIEQITVSGAGNGITFTYDLMRGEIADSAADQRISQIFSLTPLMFP